MSGRSDGSAVKRISSEDKWKWRGGVNLLSLSLQWNGPPLKTSERVIEKPRERGSISASSVYTITIRTFRRFWCVFSHQYRCSLHFLVPTGFGVELIWYNVASLFVLLLLDMYFTFFSDLGKIFQRKKEKGRQGDRGSTRKRSPDLRALTKPGQNEENVWRSRHYGLCQSVRKKSI